MEKNKQELATDRFVYVWRNDNAVNCNTGSARPVPTCSRRWPFHLSISGWWKGLRNIRGYCTGVVGFRELVL